MDTETGVGTVRYPRLEPRDADRAAKLKTRTLTNFNNERPAWLALAHKKLNAAVGTLSGVKVTRLAIASPTVQWALDRLALTPAAISRPDDAEDLVNAILKAEAAAHEAGTTNPRPWRFRDAVSPQVPAG